MLTIVPLRVVPGQIATGLIRQQPHVLVAIPLNVLVQQEWHVEPSTDANGMLRLLVIVEDLIFQHATDL